jgi:hypothetical protein
VTRVRKIPARTCIACREGADKRELVRIVRTPEGDVSVDETGKANGRGAYIHPRQQCLDDALRHSKIDRALRVRLKEDDTDRLKREFADAIGALDTH